MKTIEERYDELIDAAVTAFDREDIDAFRTANKEITAIYPVWCKEAPVVVIDPSEVSVDEMMKGLRGYKPVIKSLPNGEFLALLHGTNDGELIISPTDMVRYDDNRFANLFPEGAHVEVLACYPGSRPNKWRRNGRHFHNIGDCDERSLLLAGWDLWTDKIYVRPASKRHNDFIEFVEAKLSVPSPFREKLVAAGL